MAALRSRSEQVATKRRELVGPLQTLLAENQAAATALAARADVSSAAAEPAAPSAAGQEPAAPRPLSELVSELRWLRLPTEARAGVTYAECADFWALLQACAAATALQTPRASLWISRAGFSKKPKVCCSNR